MVRIVLVGIILVSLAISLHGQKPASAETAKLVDVPAILKETAPPDRAVSPFEDQAMLRVVATEALGQLTGESSPNDTAARWGVNGADLGHMFMHQGKLYMVFGDTFGPPGFGGKNWRSNTMARIADPDPRNGFLFESMISGPDGKATELIQSLKIAGIEKTIIPTHGISIDGRMYLHYMSVRRWAATGGVWTVGYSGFAYSDDDGRSWVKSKDAVWARNSGFEQVAFAMDGGVLYTFGIPEGRFGGVRLRRVAPEQILRRDAYEYWDGKQWVADAALAAVIVPAPVGELSVAWSESHRRWLMMYLDRKRRVVVLRTAPWLTGPWGEAQIVVTEKEYPGLYAPYIVPGTDISTDLYYTMSQWGPYNVFLMHTTLEQTMPGIVSADDVTTSGGAVVTPASKPN